MLKKWRYPWISPGYPRICSDICQYQEYLWISQIIIWLLISIDIHKYLWISQIIIWNLISTDIHEYLWIFQIIIWNLISEDIRNAVNIYYITLVANTYYDSVMHLPSFWRKTCNLKILLGVLFSKVMWNRIEGKLVF